VGPRRAWLLNFEADLELAAGRPVTPRAGLARQLAALRERVAETFVDPGDVLLPPHPAANSARGLEGACWCPTPSALETLRHAGASVPDAPAFEVLQRVNARRFCAELGPGLPGALHSEDAIEITERTGDGSPGSDWLWKRSFGVAGRGQRRVRAGALTDADRDWLRASLLEGGVQVEPRVALALEFVTHGFVHGAGRVEVHAPCVQEVDAHGAWQVTRHAAEGELFPGESAALSKAAERAGAALVQAGYFGPFGTDGFRYRDADGALRLQALGEINARYTLGWRVGFPSR